MEKELTETLDEELDNSIKKFRNAVYGDEVRTFISEYEELMLKKSKVVIDDIKKVEEGKKPIKITADVALILSIITLLLVISGTFLK